MNDHPPPPSMLDKLNGKIELIQVILKSPYAPILLLLGGFYFIGTLSEQHFARILQFWPVLRGPIGWGSIILLIIMWINSFMFGPYLEKERNLVKVLLRLDSSICDVVKTIDGYFKNVAHEHQDHMERLHRIEIELTTHKATMEEIVRRGIALPNGTVLQERRKTEKFHVPTPQESTT